MTREQMYGRELPKGLDLKFTEESGIWQLKRKGILLAQRRDEEVEKWTRPERVFSYIARRVTRGKG